jgi:TonB family protein
MLFVFASAAFSQSGTPAASGVKPPVLLNKTEPEYTPEARARKVEGTVALSVEVNREGKAVNVKIIRSLDPGLDANAVEAVKKWQFRPATAEGEPVIVTALIEFNFRFPKLPEFKRPTQPEPSFDEWEPLSTYIPKF